MSEEKKYVGTGKVITGKFGNFLKFSLKKEDLDKLYDALDNGWVNMVIQQRKEPSDKGQTHYGYIDEWKPEEKQVVRGNDEMPF